MLVVIVLVITGTRSIPALLGYWLCVLALFVTLYEFWRAAWARHNAQSQNLLQAFWQMIGKNRRRYGGYTVHIGMVLMALGIIGIEIFQTETQATVPQGGSINLGQYSVKFDSLAVFDTADGRNIARAVVSVYKDGKFVGELYPRRDYYNEAQQSMTIAGIRSTMEDDLYIILVDWQPLSTTGATFKVYDNPLVNWLWLGGIVFILGAVVAAWPEKEREKVSVHRTIPAANKATELP
jgi:cytochrome c-type biogenesis protein CcmF